MQSRGKMTAYKVIQYNYSVFIYHIASVPVDTDSTGL